MSPYKGLRPDQTRTATPATTESVRAISPRSAFPLIAGREFTDADTVHSAKVALVNQTFAKKFGLGNDAVGKFMGWAPGQGYRSRLDTTIVGVVEDAKYSDVKQNVPPQFFVPYRQDTELGGMHVYMRTSGDLAQAASAITAVVKRLDPNLPIENFESLREHVRNNTFRRSHDDDALGGVRGAGDATGGDRSLWHARLYRRTAHARDRPPHGAWSRDPTAFAPWCCVRSRA